jgi:3-deoxy-manno-octulosonate cytidylyltransferase (CMP-KDO synthetase)
MKNKIVGIIPARYASTRFPGKPLVDILGKSMIQRVYEQASAASSLSEVWVATDDQRIFDHVVDFGGKVMMTESTHRTGTERCREVSDKFKQEGKHFDVVINVQGDEPFIDPVQIDKVAACFARPEVEISTLMKRIFSNDELFSPNIIKVVTDNSNKAIYFSRSPIPYLRGKDETEWVSGHTYFKHIGVYAFRTEILEKITMLSPGSLETAESLEQLRWMENGYSIHLEITEAESHSVDTPEDLFKLKAL